ncbi:hypothetical protein ACQKNS_26730 [Peribacillus sp. NPDC094092]|uniref:hypothetical protein n=1 Tax=Peribacillus sp. NPDC094092 TaxID=3390611 RepID=UPI003D048030
MSLKLIYVDNPNLLLFWGYNLIEPGDRFEKFGINLRDKVIDVPEVSYLNFLISNGVVIIAKYWNQECQRV